MLHAFNVNKNDSFIKYINQKCFERKFEYPNELVGSNMAAQGTMLTRFWANTQNRFAWMRLSTDKTQIYVSKHKSVFYFYNKDCLTTRWCIGYLTFHFGLLLYIQHNSLEDTFSLIRKRYGANMISAFTHFSERWKAMTHHKIFTTNPVQGIANSITTFLCRYIIFQRKSMLY